MEFADAIGDASKRHQRSSVLLGNGFSIDFDPLFSYVSLMKAAELPKLSVDKEALFAAVDSTIFEVVVERLRTAAWLELLYGGSEDRAERFREDALVVRKGLADVIAALHPNSSQTPSPDEMAHAREFLHPFDEVFTLNYDMLLYWVIMSDSRVPAIPRNDGFQRVGKTMKWEPQASQDVHFLHGALHLHREDGCLFKLNRKQHGPIIRAIRQRLRADKYPLIVTEGSCEEKAGYIRRNSYLRDAHRRFAECDGALFMHGVSISPNDDHIFEKIERPESRIEALYVGIHGGVGGATAESVFRRVEFMRHRRRENGGAKLRTRFYDSASAHVWRD